MERDERKVEARNERERWIDVREEVHGLVAAREVETLLMVCERMM